MVDKQSEVMRQGSFRQDGVDVHRLDFVDAGVLQLVMLQRFLFSQQFQVLAVIKGFHWFNRLIEVHLESGLQVQQGEVARQAHVGLF